MTAAQKWDVSVFVLSTERPCDWGDLAGVGATAAPPLVQVLFVTKCIEVVREQAHAVPNYDQCTRMHAQVNYVAVLSRRLSRRSAVESAVGD